jgi:hypothetical protein
MTMTADANLRVSYEIMRMTILTAFKNNPKGFHPAYAYAWYYRMPALDRAARESAFCGVCSISLGEVKIVERTVKNLIAKGHLDSLAYNRLSEKPGLTDILHLGTILGYFSLRGDYSLLEKNALRVGFPEDQQLATEFLPDNVSFPS